MKQLLVVIFLYAGFYFGLQSFEPPDKKEREKAMGSLKNLSLEQQKAFAPDDCFKPIPEPGPTDWLTSHKEARETFRQFTNRKFPKPWKGKNKIYLQPLGEFDKNAPDLNKLKTFAEAYFGLPVVLQKTVNKKDMKFTSRKNPYSGKEQILSTDILAYLYTKKPEDAFLVLGVTMSDLYPEDSWNFVFGQASYTHRTGVFSFARYDPGFFGENYDGDIKKLILGRSLAVMVHEIGHMFGLPHCVYYNCQMNGSNNLEESDSKPMHICPLCLRKLQYQIPFNIAKRYLALHEFFVKNDFKKEQEFTRGRLEKIAPQLLEKKK